MNPSLVVEQVAALLATVIPAGFRVEAAAGTLRVRYLGTDALSAERAGVRI